MNRNVRKKKELCLLLYHTSMVQQTVTKEVHAFFISSHFFNTTSLFNPLSANPAKWSNTLKQFVGNLPTNCLSVFDHFVKLAFKGLMLLKCFKSQTDVILTRHAIFYIFLSLCTSRSINHMIYFSLSFWFSLQLVI